MRTVKELMTEVWNRFAVEEDSSREVHNLFTQSVLGRRLHDVIGEIVKENPEEAGQYEEDLLTQHNSEV